MNTTRLIAGVGLGSAALLAVGAVFGSFYTVDQGDRAVLLRNGALASVEQPGLHFKTPCIEAVHQVDVQTRTQRYSKVNSYSQDQQPADIAISVTYHVDPDAVAVVYGRFGSVEALECSATIRTPMRIASLGNVSEPVIVVVASECSQTRSEDP